MNEESFGKRIRELREKCGLTQSQLAEQMNVSRSTLANWEIGRRLPDLSMLARLADCLKVESYVLMDVLRDTVLPVRILIVEDIPFLLSSFSRMLRAEIRGADVHGFTSADEAMAWARAAKVDIAFLDIALNEQNGLVLGRELTALYPRINIIFLTSYPEYMADALSDHCSGYILKPLTPEKLHAEMTHLRFPVRGISE